MSFVKIDYNKKDSKWSMAKFQSHPYYEFHFLLSGTRRFFLNDCIFHIDAPMLCIIPPFQMHKTDGEAYERINLYLSPTLLTQSEVAFLKNLKDNVFQIDFNNQSLIFELLRLACSLSPTTQSDNLLLNIAHVVLHLLSETTLTPNNKFVSSISEREANKRNLIMDVVDYINNHYAENFSIKDVSSKFSISKSPLCQHFVSVMHCSIMQYRLLVRINKAKELLLSTNKSLEEISEAIGFSSANYFSLIFKKIIGIAPSYYKKTK